MLNNYEYDKNFIKQNLTEEDIMDLLAELGGDPRKQNGAIVSRTICHCGEQHKLYYYPNSGLFKCYTDCSSTFDAFELVKKVVGRDKENFELPQAVKYIAQKFGFAPKDNTEVPIETIEDWKIFQAYERIKNISKTSQQVELKEYADTALRHLPRPIIIPWVEENIRVSAMNTFEICYNPKSNAIVIPHRDLKGRLVGIRERTLIEENAELYGKYRPAYINRKLYNHPLSFNLYGLYQNQYNISKIKKAVIVEGEKAVLQYESYFGRDNNIAVACCGSNVIAYQIELLKRLGVEEIIIALDRQFVEPNDDEFKKLTKNLEGINKKYGNSINISFIWDKDRVTPYKASPLDCGKDIFIRLFQERINLYGN